MFTTVRHSFASLIDLYTAFKKGNTNDPRVIVRTFPTNIPNPLLFSNKSAQKFPLKFATFLSSEFAVTLSC